VQVTLMTSVALVPEVPEGGLLVLSCARSQLPVQPGDLDRLADAARLSTLALDALAAALAHELDTENPVPVHPSVP
jgi:hypothetical protein